MASNPDDMNNSLGLSTNNQAFLMQTDDMDGGDEGENSNRYGKEDKGEPLREQDRFLPIANIAKIMKRAVPESGKIAKDARECVQECVSEFISFITSEASERCAMEKRKTINGEDILCAMQALGFDNYIEPLKIYLQKYRESTKGDKSLLGLYEEVTEQAYSTAGSSGEVQTDSNTQETSSAAIYTTYSTDQSSLKFEK